METDGQTSTVTYTCANHYEIVGDATRECQTDGTWTGVNATCGEIYNKRTHIEFPISK